MQDSSLVMTNAELIYRSDNAYTTTYIIQVTGDVANIELLE